MHPCLAAGKPNIFGELEIVTFFRSSALFAKALSISKSISKTHIFLEIALEMGSASEDVDLLGELTRSPELSAQRFSPYQR